MKKIINKGQKLIIYIDPGSGVDNNKEPIIKSIQISKSKSIDVIWDGDNPDIPINPIIPDIPVPIYEPVDPYEDPIFNELIDSFNHTLYDSDTSKIIANNVKSQTYSYLASMFKIGYNEWTNGTLFNEDLYFEPVAYRNPSNDEDNETYKAMQAWLMGMCLAEIIPNDGNSTNNQTNIFKCAYQFGPKDLYKEGSADDNGNIILENCYSIKQDPTISRIVASIIYALNHDKFIDEINKSRSEFRSNCINSSYNYSSNHIGYFVNGDDIFGTPPGPFTTTAGYNTPNKKPSGQTSSLFFNNNPDSRRDWYKFNYKMDVAIDKYVMEHYNCYCSDDNYVNDDIDTSDRTEANNLAFINNTYKDIIVDAGIVPCASDFIWHGKKYLKYTGVLKTEYGYPKGNGDIYIHKFELSSSNNGDNVFEYISPYYIDSKPNLWYSNPQVNSIIESDNMQGTPTEYMNFMCDIRYLADDHRNFSYANRYGRRRPLGGAELGHTRRENRQDSPLNGINKFFASRWCRDTYSDYVKINKIYKNPNDKYGSEMYADDFPHDPPHSWPSGHASQTWGPALYLCQMIGNKNEDFYNIIKRSYRLGSLRSIGRFHWNSDIMIGRLYGCMFLPLLNANKSFISNYNKLKQKLSRTTIKELKDYGYDGGDVINNIDTPTEDVYINITIQNDYGTLPITGEINLYFNPLDNTSGHESLTITLGSVVFANSSTYLTTPLAAGTHQYQNCKVINGKAENNNRYPYKYLNTNLHQEVVVYTPSDKYGHISEYIKAKIDGDIIGQSGNYNITNQTFTNGGSYKIIIYDYNT